MTVPFERFRAVKNAEQFLLDLCNPKVTPRVPKSIREQARWCLKHYPSQFDMEEVAKACPDRFSTKF